MDKRTRQRRASLCLSFILLALACSPHAHVTKYNCKQWAKCEKCLDVIRNNTNRQWCDEREACCTIEGIIKHRKDKPMACKASDRSDLTSSGPRGDPLTGAPLWICPGCGAHDPEQMYTHRYRRSRCCGLVPVAPAWIPERMADEPQA